FYKRYCQPAASPNDAILELISDDGSPYSDYYNENQFPVVSTLTIAGGSTYSAANLIDYVGTYGNPAIFVQISVTGNNVTCKLNGSASALLPIAKNTTQTLQVGDLAVSSLNF